MRANTQKQGETITLTWVSTILQAVTITQADTIIRLNCEHHHTRAYIIIWANTIIRVNSEHDNTG